MMNIGLKYIYLFFSSFFLFFFFSFSFFFYFFSFFFIKGFYGIYEERKKYVITPLLRILKYLIHETVLKFLLSF